MRTWRNWQTRWFQVPVKQFMWVQVPSSAPMTEIFSRSFFFLRTFGRRTHSRSFASGCGDVCLWQTRWDSLLSLIKCPVVRTRKRLRIGYNPESFLTKSTLSGENRIYDEIRLDGGWVDLISSKLGLDFICHRQISSRSDFIIAFLQNLCYTYTKR